jgi:hypothetical protein
MSRVVFSAGPAAYVVMLLLGGVVTVGSAQAAHANDVDAAPSYPWCIARGDLPPDCTYSDPLACNIAAFLTVGACVKAEPSVSPATTVAAAPVRQKRKMVQRKPPAAEHDKLFREFVRWKRDAAN